ncbi:MAG TPA: PAS domain S-box protein, partial [Ferruginibacter sp.]|nr:PAS domain S-box protein [Ferruginibacter sp.]
MSIMPTNKESFLNSTDSSSKNTPSEVERTPSGYEDKFPHLLNLIPSAITYVDKNHHLLYANEAFKKMFHCHLNAVEGEPMINCLGNNAYETSRQFMDAALAGGDVSFEMELALKDSTSYIETNYRPDYDNNGNIIGIAGIMNDITQKKLAENKLIFKNEELQDYIDNASIALHWVDSNGIILWANKAELKMLGYTEQEYFGQPIANFHADNDKINHILSLLGNDEIIQDYEATLKHKDGSTFTVLINSSVLRENGKFVHTRCFTTNINDRKLLEDSLQKSRDRYQLLMENLPAALYTCDIDGRITLYNQAAADLWGRHPELGKDLWCGSLKIFNPDGITALTADSNPMALTLKKGQAIQGKEIIIERPDGKRINVQTYPVPLVDNEGKVLGAVNMLMDISEQKIAENKLAYLAAIVHSSSDPIIGITLDGIVTSWNEAAERVFGYSMEEMVGESLFKIIPEDLLEEEYLIFERLKKGEMVTHIETRRSTKDHTILNISGTISPIKNNEGHVIGASKILRDITAQKVQDEALRESEERLRMASESVKLGTWEYFPAKKQMVWSEEAEKIYGVPHDFVASRDFIIQHIHPDDLALIDAEVRKALLPEGNGVFQFLTRIYRATDNQLRWLK